MRGWLSDLLRAYLRLTCRKSHEGILIPILMILPMAVFVVFAGAIWPPLARKWDRFVEETLGKVE